MNKRPRKGERNLPVPSSSAPAQSSKGIVNVDAARLTEIVRGVILEFAETLPEQETPEQKQRLRTAQGRTFKLRLRARMKQFQSVYNKGWFVRHSEFQERQYREKMMREFWAACQEELQGCSDIEAFTYAVADALTAYRYGVPWE